MSVSWFATSSRCRCCRGQPPITLAAASRSGATADRHTIGAARRLPSVRDRAQRDGSGATWRDALPRTSPRVKRIAPPLDSAGGTGARRCVALPRTALRGPRWATPLWLLVTARRRYCIASRRARQVPSFSTSMPAVGSCPCGCGRKKHRTLGACSRHLRTCQGRWQSAALSSVTRRRSSWVCRLNSWEWRN